MDTEGYKLLQYEVCVPMSCPFRGQPSHRGGIGRTCSAILPLFLPLLPLLAGENQFLYTEQKKKLQIYICIFDSNWKFAQMCTSLFKYNNTFKALFRRRKYAIIDREQHMATCHGSCIHPRRGAIICADYHTFSRRKRCFKCVIIHNMSARLCTLYMCINGYPY